ncbi:hypothetical protein [Enterovibrio norvegicus]|uniref:hypothetical protein n=1 Tax=Enterovibrio norvegicus TaxID=188144 RepID=UPI000C85843F|nr:hypothetical protein [Enterovibrio norvegicus]PMH64497.1 hypothetical protein BCU62_15700 [Enterovibrio norvegicus]
MKIVISMCLLFLSTACTYEQEPSEALCTTVENSKINPDETGFRDVVLITDNADENIGYFLNGELVAHSECTSALKNVGENSGQKYEWFMFGQKIERNGIQSIEFYTTGAGVESTLATRLETSMGWQRQYRQRGVVTREIWLNEPNLDSITSSSNFDNDGVIEVIVISDVISKTKSYDANTAQFDCSWSDSGVLTLDQGCANESTIDNTIFGTIIDSDFYLNELNNATDSYPTDRSEIEEDIERYFK